MAANVYLLLARYEMRILLVDCDLMVVSNLSP